MRRLIWGFAGRIYHIVGNLAHWLKWYILATMQDNLTFFYANNKRHRPACTLSQSNQQPGFSMTFLPTCPYYQRHYDVWTKACQYQLNILCEGSEKWRLGHFYGSGSPQLNLYSIISQLYPEGRVLILAPTYNPSSAKKKCIWKCRLLKSSAANNCLALLTN